MSITGVGPRSTSAIQSLVDMRRQLDDLQRQLGTGKKADSYAGLGVDRSLVVQLRGQLSAIAGYNDTINTIGVRLDLAQSTLARIGGISHDLKAAVVQSASDGGQTLQKTALAQLGEILGLLNTQAGDRYLFSGRSSDRPAVDSIDHILDGDGARAGLRQIIAERAQADLGANGLGRLALTAPSATSVSLAEDVAGSPFGFKLAGVASTLTGAGVSGPGGSPAAVVVDLTAAAPQAGQTLQLRFTLPDGSDQTLTLTATHAVPPGANQFSLGASPAATAANLQAAIGGAVGTLAAGALTVASGMAASQDFFAADAGHPPRRVAGPAFAAATGFVAGTAADSVIWYTGAAGSDPARATASARVDASVSVAYGLRANEDGIRAIVQHVAALAALAPSPALPPPPGTQHIDAIRADLAGAQTVVAAAKARHQQSTSTLGELLQQTEGVPPEQVAAQILALQTRLQASLQTTAMLFQTSLVKYL
jgi:flagellar hook-associated protein 3 FlgL